MSLHRRVKNLEESAGPPKDEPPEFWGPRYDQKPEDFQYRSNGHWWTDTRPDGTRVYEYWDEWLTAEELKKHGFDLPARMDVPEGYEPALDVEKRLDRSANRLMPLPDATTEETP